jgi:hypothetical protein
MVVNNETSLHINIPTTFQKLLFSRKYCITLNILFADAINGYGVSEAWRASIDIQTKTCVFCKEGTERFEPTIPKLCSRHRFEVVFVTVFEANGNTAQEAMNNLASEVDATATLWERLNIGAKANPYRHSLHNLLYQTLSI